MYYYTKIKVRNGKIKDLNRKLTKSEYKEIEEYVYQLDIKNGYMQNLGEHEEEYVPQWDD